MARKKDRLLEKLPGQEVLQKTFESIEQPSYTEKDLEQWRNGTEQFKQFWEELPLEVKAKLSPDTTGNLQAIFLGEKPALFYARGTEHLDNTILEKFDCNRVGDYVYNRSLVRAVMIRYPEVFQIFESSEPDAVIKKLAEHYTPEHDRARGLILGYPLPEIIGYEKNKQINSIMHNLYNLLPEGSYEKNWLMETYFGTRVGNEQAIIDFFVQEATKHMAELGIQEDELSNLVDELRYSLNAKFINIHEVKWIEYAHSQDSKRKQERLKTAFETSGILDVR